jgi:tRNA(Glu) U13 pseudouridine synthase TruD
MPEGLEGSAASDDMNAGRQKLTLEFVLPRGCYATLIVKRLGVS